MGKSNLQQTTSLIYLGLHIDTTARILKPTTACTNHMMDLVAIVPAGSRQDLQDIAGYVSWLPYAMGWPLFLANLVRHRNVYWIQ
jgi:hypothetical protein